MLYGLVVCSLLFVDVTTRHWDMSSIVARQGAGAEPPGRRDRVERVQPHHVRVGLRLRGRLRRRRVPRAEGALRSVHEVLRPGTRFNRKTN